MPMTSPVFWEMTGPPEFPLRIANVVAYVSGGEDISPTTAQAVGERR